MYITPLANGKKRDLVNHARILERELAAEKARVEKLALFAADMFRLSDWPDGGDIDGFDFQDAAVARGLLVPETRTEPCGESCHCAEFHGEMTGGVTCYRYSPILKEAIALSEGSRDAD